MTDLTTTPANDIDPTDPTVSPQGEPGDLTLSLLSTEPFLLEIEATAPSGASTTMRFSREAAITLRAALGRVLSNTAELPENFTDYPMTVSEAKGELYNDSESWTPRDALIAALRDLDSHSNFQDPEDIVMRTTAVHYVERPDGSKYLQSYDSIGTIAELIGILVMLQNDILYESRND